MKAIPLLIALAFLAGCQTVQHETASGRPEVTIRASSADPAKSYIVGRMLNEGYSVTADTQYRIQFDRPTENFGAALLLGSNFNSRPNERVSYTFAQLGQDIRIVADLAFVTNPGTSFERITTVTNSPASLDYQSILDDLRSQPNR